MKRVFACDVSQDQDNQFHPNRSYSASSRIALVRFLLVKPDIKYALVRAARQVLELTNEGLTLPITYMESVGFMS